MKSLFSRVTGWDGFSWIVAIVGVLVISTLLSWLYWKDLHGGQDSLSTTIRNLGLVIGGFVAMLLAVWRSQVATRQAETAQQSLLNERYQQGAEMLGSEVLSVRLGGIYTLERLAADHPKEYHVQVMKLFCGFVRFPTKEKGIQFHPAIGQDQDVLTPRLRADVQDVLRAIGSRSIEGVVLEQDEDSNILYLPEAQLIGLQIQDAVLSGAWLTDANLSGATLPRVNLSCARLVGADLSGTKLWGANLSRAILRDANMSGTDLFGADAHSSNTMRQCGV